MESSSGPVPPLPCQSSARQHQSRRKDGQSQLSASRTARHASPTRTSARPPASPASPDIISSLITSLDIASKKPSSPSPSPSPTPDRGRAVHSPQPPLRSPLPISPPKSPLAGSFGVDYGAFNSSSRDTRPRKDASLDDLAASPPVVRTSKPPSGYSAATAPKSPSREEGGGGGLRSLLRAGASRPSSRGSQASRDADAQSIGNLSIEPGEIPPVPELKRQRSIDSWGKKAGRAHRGLMYMSSRERLRDKEEKKRSSGGAIGSERGGSNPVSPRQDVFLAEVPISEEPSNLADTILSPSLNSPTAAASPRAIPDRNSSLRKTGSKRSSQRRSTKREGESSKTIPEVEEQATSSRRKNHESHGSDTDVYLFYSKMDNVPARPSSRSRSLSRSQSRSQSRTQSHRADEKPLPHLRHRSIDADIEEGAPSPAIAQRRRRDRSRSVEVRHSRRNSSDGKLRSKRSSSLLRRRSKVEGGRSPTPDAHIGYERPPSADSVDDAVESYLCSPRLSQKIKHPQTGRVISFSEVGDSEGSAVFCCVGMGLTRYITAFYDELALTLKLRLITPDRPGVGDSEAYADGTATPLGWPDDVYAICQALKITKFSILAHSAGAIYALATALRMPQHIRGRIHLLAPWIPPSQMSVFGASAQTPLPPTNAIPTSQRILRALPTPFLKAANSSFMTATSSSITSSLPKTPRKKRKGANVAKDREKEAAARSQAQHHANSVTPPPLDGYENKENNGDRPSGLVHGDITASEEMDLFRPSHLSTGSVAAVTSPSGHKRSPSTASQAHAAREAAVLAAAASAIADRERQATYDTRLTHAIWELATTGANPAVDLLVCLERRHTIGFRYVDITRPVVIHHGSRDTRVPVENVRWLGKTMRRCEVRVLEGEGHGLMASASVMGGVLMEISKEWEDWTRLTGVAARRGAAAERERERALEDSRVLGVGVAR